MRTDHPGDRRRFPAGGRVTVQVHLDVNRERREVAGALDSGAGESRPFHGWLGLLGELERIIDEAATSE